MAVGTYFLSVAVFEVWRLAYISRSGTCRVSHCYLTAKAEQTPLVVMMEVVMLLRHYCRP